MLFSIARVKDEPMEQPYLFISHSTKDHRQTEYIVGKLSEAGYRCWVDIESIPDGSTWLNEIEKGVNGCAGMVVVYTANARTSEWVQAETLMARDLNKPLFIARFDDTPLALHLMTRQAGDFSKRRAPALKKLLASLKSMVLDPPPVADTPKNSPDPNRHNFFKYLEQLPGGTENSRTAREVFQWAKANADNITFSGRTNPAFHAHVEIGLGGVVVFSMRAFPKQPAVEIPLQYFTEFPPFDLPERRLQALKAINAMLPAEQQLDESRADRKPNIPLSVLAQAQHMESFKAMIGDIFKELRRGR